VRVASSASSRRDEDSRGIVWLAGRPSRQDRPRDCPRTPRETPPGATWKDSEDSSSLAVDEMILRVTLLIVCALLAGAVSEPRPRPRPVPIYSNQFAVYVPSGAEAADDIAQEHGFDNHGQVSATELCPGQVSPRFNGTRGYRSRPRGTTSPPRSRQRLSSLRETGLPAREGGRNSIRDRRRNCADGQRTWIGRVGRVARRVLADRAQQVAITCARAQGGRVRIVRSLTRFAPVSCNRCLSADTGPAWPAPPLISRRR